MKGARGAVLATAILVAGCSELARVRVYNLTGGPITIRVKSAVYDRRDAFDELITIAPNRSRAISGSRFRNDRLPVIVGRCTYVYRLGLELYDLETYYGYPIPVELRAGLTLDLPPHRGEGPDPVPRASLGFPRRAISRTCV